MMGYSNTNMRANIGAQPNVQHRDNCKLICVVCNTKLNPQTFEHQCRGRKPDEKIKLKPSVNPAN